MKYNSNEEGHITCSTIPGCIVNLILLLTHLTILLLFFAITFKIIIIITYIIFKYMLTSVLQETTIFLTLNFYDHFYDSFFFFIFMLELDFLSCLILPRSI